MRSESILVMALLFISVSLQAEVITIFDSNSVIANGDTYDTVVVKGDGTIVDMTGGTVNKLITMNASTFNMSGGNIVGPDWRYRVVSYDSSTLNISGGNVRTLQSHNESKVNISGNVSFSFDLSFRDSTIVTISSSDVSIDHDDDGLVFYGNSTLNLLAGSMRYVVFSGEATLNMTGGFITDYLSLTGDSKVNISGGTVNEIQAGHAETRISGGTINSIRYNSVPQFPKEIGIIGYGLSVVPYGGDYGAGVVTGFWNNDVFFRIDLQGNTSPYKDIFLYDGIIPPNCVSKPESDISGDCIVNVIDLSKMASEWLDDGTE